MTKEEKAVVRAAIDYIAVWGSNSQPCKKAALEQAVLRYSAKKAEEVRDAGLADRRQWAMFDSIIGKSRRWEYYVWLPSDPDMFLQDLAELGQCGWELVLREPDDIYVFKRPMLQCGEGDQE